MASQHIVNLEEVLKDAARTVLSTSLDDDDAYIPVEELKYDSLSMVQQPIINEYNLQAAANGRPTHQVKNSQIFKNPDDEVSIKSTMSFTQTSATSNRAQINVTSGVYFGSGFGIPLRMDSFSNRVVQDIFGPSLTIIGKSCDTREEKNSLTYSNEFNIPPGKSVEVTMLMDVKRYSSDFKMATKLKGRVTAVANHPQTGRPIAVEVDIYEAVSRSSAAQQGGVIQLDQRSKSVVVQTKGSVEFRVSMLAETEVRPISAFKH